MDGLFIIHVLFSLISLVLVEAQEGREWNFTWWLSSCKFPSVTRSISSHTLLIKVFFVYKWYMCKYKRTYNCADYIQNNQTCMHTDHTDTFIASMESAGSCTIHTEIPAWLQHSIWLMGRKTLSPTRNPINPPIHQTCWGDRRKKERKRIWIWIV